MENRIRMQILILFYILGINIFQATGGDNSTQMIYFSLTIEESALKNITQILKPFVLNDLLVDNPTVTTFCTSVSSGTTCSCKEGYIWSDKVCWTQKCCDNDNCTFSQNPAHMCIANTTVKITGSISLDAQLYQQCLADQKSEGYKTCNENLNTQMQTVYSTLRGFDTLTITKYSVGSVIADFQVILVSDLSSQELLKKSEELSKNLNASLNLETSGVVRISKPPKPVCYWSQLDVTCTSQDDLGINPTWWLQQQGAEYDITNGTEAVVISVPRKTTVSLKNITELWGGAYVCAYVTKTSSLTITHKASTVMDVALLPNIYISTNPQYPRCKDDRDVLKVIINCQIAQSNETYNVSWSAKDITAAITEDKYSPGQTTYSASTFVNCKSNPTPQVMCTFKNRCNQTESTSTYINIIKYGEEYCAANGEWPDTKAGYTAVMQCKNAAGQIQRKCLNSAKWDQENSQCVYQVLYNAWQKSMIVDIGRGSLDINAAAVFSQLQGATNNSQLINTFANMKASVDVLSNLKSKLQQINNASAVNDFLASSSNILDTSLQNSWTNNNNNTNNLTLAETYLDSVEGIIKKASLVDSNKTNVEVDICNVTGCKNTVFNVSVTLKSSNNGSVKTAGFQQLQNYLPYNNNSQPNSIVVSTTTENKSLDSVEITIDFQLLSPRPRNVKIECVAWNNTTREWSSHGCYWPGASDPGRCICNHLSAYTTLMSRYPIELSGATEITYAGLSVSVISLLVALLIEMTVWSAVVKTNTLYLRHTTHVNISICLIIADCCFLASDIKDIPPIWCQTFGVLKHFCYLAMFFWMLCLSTTLLHQAIFLFHNVSKTNYLRFSLVLGYVCPFLIVFITFLTNNAGAEGSYYSREGCWLIYTGVLQGSIYTFVIPVGIIIFINVFSMLVVIMKLLDHPKATDKSHEKEKNAAKTVLRTVILLTPIFGITWSLGFAVMILDLTSGLIAYVVNYAFTLLNAFQGFFIFLTTCIGDRMVRETLLNRFRKNALASISESTTKLESSWKK